MTIKIGEAKLPIVASVNGEVRSASIMRGDLHIGKVFYSISMDRSIKQMTELCLKNQSAQSP
jgi:hypothetical protein